MTAKKHHYVPQCYLKGWIGADRMLCEYRKVNGRIVTKRRHPAETGYSHSLYSVETLPPDMVDMVEEIWFARVDQDASDALDVYRQGNTLTKSEMVSGWSRFLMSLMRRHPGGIDKLWHQCQRELQRMAAQQPASEHDLQSRNAVISDPAGWLGKLFVSTVQIACNHRKIGQHINDMHTSVMTLTGGRGRFMTSDNPLIISNGLSYPDAFIALPISPMRMWMATNNEVRMDELTEFMRTGHLIEFVNRTVVDQAYAYSYALCENQLEFVEKYSTYSPPVPRFDVTAAGVEVMRPISPTSS